MMNSKESKITSLLRLIEKKALMKKMDEEKRKQEETPIPYLPSDCVSNILIRLPLDALQRSMLVCKLWCNMINNSKFIDAYLSRSESVLIFLERRYRPFLEKPNTFSVEGKLLQSKPLNVFDYPISKRSSKISIKFLENKDNIVEIRDYNISCLGNLRASCNGLILLDNKIKKGGLVVMNPVTRKLISLPVGTMCSDHCESYGFAISSVTCEYKLVHLFQDALSCVNCEILNFRTRIWREIDGPSSGLIHWFGYNPVFSIDALHWIPEIDRSDYIVSMEVDNEKFHQIPLPRSCRTHDRVLDVGGFLGFVVHEEFNQIDVWILRDLFGKVWTKHHSITIGCILDMVPLLTLRIKGDMIFMREEDGSLYVYNFQLLEMSKIEMVTKCFPLSYSFLPHVNGLTSLCGEEGTQ